MKDIIESINLFVDVDDTLTKSSKLAVEKLNKIFNKCYSYEQLKEYSFKDLFPECNQDLITEIFADENFYNEVEPIENGKETINSYRNNTFYSMHICTIGDQANLINKYNWIINNIHGKINIHGIFLHQNKGMLDMKNGIQIDDNTSNLKCTNAAIKILLKNGLEKKYNQVEPNENIYIANDWYEIAEMLSFYEKIGSLI